MDRVWQLLEKKGREVWSISPNDTVYQALEFLASKDVGAVIVLDRGKVAGIFSERDYARRVVLQGKKSTDTPVREVMSTDVLYVSPSFSVEECMAVMTENHIRHLPVLDGDQLVGVISIGDLVKSVISTQSFMIEQLENYISGKRS
jgi:CBS domain-containing protein